MTITVQNHAGTIRERRSQLHAEKFYRTVTEEFAATRSAFRWRQLVALARITASAYGLNRQDQPGHRAPGYLQARELLQV